MKRTFAICAAVLLIAASALASSTIVEEIVARINNQIVTRSELQRAREQAIQEIRQQNPPNLNEKISDVEKNILRDLIDQHLLVQKGEDLGITGETEMIKQLDEMRKKAGLETMEDLEREAQKQGISFEDFKQQMKESIVTQMVISREVGGHIRITGEEVRQFYEEKKNELAQPERVRLGEILISTQKKDADGKVTEMNEQEIAAAEAKAKQLVEELRKGAKFEDVAKKNSDGPTAEHGGDLQYFQRGMLAKELEDRTFAMKAGEVTDVIRTKQGFIILKVTEHTPAGVPALKDIEPRIQEALYMKKIQPALRAYLTKLREEAYVDVKTGYLDTGASAKQTKPVMTAANADDKDKEKKRKKKLGIF